MQTDRPLQIGFMAYDLRYIFWSIAVQSMKKLAADAHITLHHMSVSDIPTALHVLELFIQQRVDAIITIPAFDEPAFTQVIKQALDHGIKVVIFDSTASELVDTYHIHSNNFAGGEKISQYLCQQMGGKGRLVHLQGQMPSHSARARTEGLHHTLTNYPQIELLFEAGLDWSFESGYTLMKQVLTQHQQFEAIFCGSDPIAFGALAALREADWQDQVLITGYDGQIEAIRAIYQGQMLATIWQNPAGMSESAFYLATELLAKRPVTRELAVETMLVTNQNAIDVTFQTINLLPMVLQDLVDNTVTQAQLQEQLILSQQRLIQEISTPIIPITDEILIMPLIGSINKARSEQIMQKMLAAVAQQHAQVLLLDMTGVTLIDTSTLNYLIQATRAVQLLGAKVILVGVAPEIAQTIVQLGIDLSTFLTHSTLQAGLNYALKKLVTYSKKRMPVR